jgi:hypothetical protein
MIDRYVGLSYKMGKKAQLTARLIDAILGILT